MLAIQPITECRECGTNILSDETLCKECQATLEISRIENMDIDLFAKLLEGLFFNCKQKFTVTGSEIVLTYFCADKERLQKADFLLSAYGSREHIVKNDRVVFSMKSMSRAYGATELGIA